MAIRVLHIINSLGLGGAQTCLKYIFERPGNPQIEQFVYPLRPKPVDIGLDAEMITYNYPYYDPRKFLAILRICQDYKIDILHAHLHKSILGALLATYFRKVRVVAHEHGPIFRPGLQYSGYRLLLRRLQHRASRFIATSQATARQLETVAGIDPRQIEVIYNAVDPDAFTPDAEARGRLRNQFSFVDDNIVLGYVGRLHPVKGPDLLLEALAILLRHSKRYRLLLVGHGSEQSALEKQARQLGIEAHVQFLGFRDNVAELMNAFDIGVVPSRQESFGIAALEFMRAQVPLVSSNVEGLAEFVHHESTALVPSSLAPEKIAACVERLVQDPSLQDKLVQRAFQSTNTFGIENHVQAIEQVYRNVLQEPLKS